MPFVWFLPRWGTVPSSHTCGVSRLLMFTLKMRLETRAWGRSQLEDPRARHSMPQFPLLENKNDQSACLIQWS